MTHDNSRYERHLKLCGHLPPKLAGYLWNRATFLVHTGLFSEEEREDILQEFHLAMQRVRDRGNLPEHATPYLFRTIAFTAITLLRIRQRRPLPRPFDAALIPEEQLHDRLEREEEDDGTAFLRALDLSDLLAELPAKEAELLRRLLRGEPLRPTLQALGITHHAYRTHLLPRLKARLR